MPIAHKIETAVRTYRTSGFDGVLSVLRRKGVPIPQGRRSRWREGVEPEVQFWDDFVRTRGLQWPHNYERQLDPAAPLQARAAELLPDRPEVHILDVGAGPFTFLGKTLPDRRVFITAVDPLADEYAAILAKYRVEPPIRTERLAGEDLATRFAPDTFDLAYARNCLDHAYDPERAILQMTRVVKPGSYVLLEHRLNVAEIESYRGFHQWNFSVDPAGDFVIRSRSASTNFTRRHADRFAIACELVMDDQMEFLVVRILKD